jgi:hypothetical protein
MIECGAKVASTRTYGGNDLRVFLIRSNYWLFAERLSYTVTTSIRLPVKR